MKRLLWVGSVAVLAVSCAGPAAPIAVDLELNWAGVTVKDFDAAYSFYLETLELAEARTGDWATLSSGPGRSMTLELFTGTHAADPERAWGVDQAVRIGLVVPNLDDRAAVLRARGAALTTEAPSPWGRQLELVAPEAIRWSLVESNELVSANSGALCVCLAEIKVVDLAAQTRFYRDLMGMPVESADSQRVVMVRHPEGPYLSLVPGGTPTNVDPNAFDGAAPDQAVILSFETTAVFSAADRLRAAGATFLSEPTHYPDWGGTAFYVADADGNPVQVVQYD